MKLSLVKYEENYKDRWDDFVLNSSVNGTFLQTRNFLNYHPKGRFNDSSILLMNSSNIVGVIPANAAADLNGLSFCSHMGSTFGGIILSPNAYNISYLENIMPLLDEFFKSEGYNRVVMKATSDLFSQKSMALLDYEYFRFGYSQYNEISFYIDLKCIQEDALSIMTSSRRRDCRYSLKNDFKMVRLTTDEQVGTFYGILQENLKKFDSTPIHTEAELLKFKNNLLSDIVRFYGVYEGDKMVAGSMLFDFGHKVLHTQYLACLPEYNRKYAMNFMDYNLIMIAKNEGYRYFSFGTSTGNHGKDLNVGLALYKEGFGCEYSVNRIYVKSL